MDETSENAQADVPMYIRYYRRTGIPDTLDKRRSSLVGYVYAPFRFNDFIKRFSAELDDLEVRIYDCPAVTEDALLSESGSHRLEYSSSP